MAELYPNRYYKYKVVYTSQSVLHEVKGVIIAFNLDAALETVRLAHVWANSISILIEEIMP